MHVFVVFLTFRTTFQPLTLSKTVDFSKASRQYPTGRKVNTSGGDVCGLYCSSQLAMPLQLQVNIPKENLVNIYISRCKRSALRYLKVHFVLGFEPNPSYLELRSSSPCAVQRTCVNLARPCRSCEGRPRPGLHRVPGESDSFVLDETKCPYVKCLLGLIQRLQSMAQYSICKMAQRTPSRPPPGMSSAQIPQMSCLFSLALCLAQCTCYSDNTVRV